MKTLTDTYWEHPQHDIYRSDCSSCFAENMIAKQSARMSYEEIREHNYQALNPRDGSSPWDRNPFE